MPEHLIRLRGPWELRTSTDSSAPSARVVLPTESLPVTEQPIVLLRHFGRPARVSESPSCRLRCESVPGVFRIRLNGELLTERSSSDPYSTDPIEVPIPGPLRLRNQLELSVLPPADHFPSSAQPWGSILLVFEEDTQRPCVDESARLTR